MDLTVTGTSIVLASDGIEICRYVYRPDMPADHVPRPYLHPVRTLGGVVTTDASPPDHPWHYGISIAIPMIAGSSFWGGPTYVDGSGYVALPNHGQVNHREWLELDAGPDTATFRQQLSWHGHGGELLLDEDRTLTVRTHAACGQWSLDLRTRMRNVTGWAVLMGSPATAGRKSAGYGGLFMRMAPEFRGAHIVDADGRIDADAFGRLSSELTVSAGNARVTLGADPAAHEPWFVRRHDYPGVCAALAFRRPLHLEPGDTMARSYRIMVGDARRAHSSAARSPSPEHADARPPDRRAAAGARRG